MTTPRKCVIFSLLCLPDLQHVSVHTKVRHLRCSEWGGGGGMRFFRDAKAGDGPGAEDVNSLNQVKTINNSNSKP